MNKAKCSEGSGVVMIGKSIHDRKGNQRDKINSLFSS